MAFPTVTTQLNSGSTYTTIAVTAATQAAKSGAKIYVGVDTYHCEIFTLSADMAVNDTTLHVASQQAAATHPVGDKVAPQWALSAIGRTLSPIQVPRTKRI